MVFIKGLRFLMVSAALAMVAGLPRGARAEIGFELYSWKTGTRWNYAVFEGTSTVRTQEALRLPKNRFKDISYLKGRIAALPSGETLYWRVDKRRGLVLPPKEIIRELNNFAATAQIKLLLPGQNSDDKVLEQLQSEVQEIVE